MIQAPQKGPTNTSQFDHTSMLATAKNLFNLPGFLTKRDAWAGSFDEVRINLFTPLNNPFTHINYLLTHINYLFKQHINTSKQPNKHNKYTYAASVGRPANGRSPPPPRPPEVHE